MLTFKKLSFAVFSFRTTCVFAILSWCISAFSTTLDSKQIFERIRPSVVEVQTKTRGNQGIAAAASGFLVHRKDWIVTNYHAVTEALFEPADNELSVVTHSGARVPAQVVAVDVVHDLAILQLKTALSAPVLPLREQWPAKGEAGYSMGKPGQYQHSIVGGTFNGVIDEGSAPQIVFSGAINPGMSGGPTLDAMGRVVGINVASSTENQLLGLAVPAQALAKLIEQHSPAEPPDNSALRKGIASQFAAHGRLQLQAMPQDGMAVRQLGPFQVLGDLSADKECETSRHDAPGRRYRMLEQRCDSAMGLYIMPKLYAGQMVTGAFWLQGKNLGRLEMARLVERRLNDLRRISEEDTTPARWTCHEQRLSAAGGLAVHLHACQRPVAKLPGLYDYRFRYAPLVQGQDALVVAMGLSGFDKDTARAVLRRSLAALRHDAQEDQ